LPVRGEMSLVHRKSYRVPIITSGTTFGNGQLPHRSLSCSRHWRLHTAFWTTKGDRTAIGRRSMPLEGSMRERWSSRSCVSSRTWTTACSESAKRWCRRVRDLQRASDFACSMTTLPRKDSVQDQRRPRLSLSTGTSGLAVWAHGVHTPEPSP
jgi:hypothetical protein